MRGLTFQQMIDLMNKLPEEFRNSIYYKEAIIGWDTFVLKTIDYSLICYIEEDNIKWIKRHTWKTPRFDEVIYDSKSIEEK